MTKPTDQSVVSRSSAQTALQPADPHAVAALKSLGAGKIDDAQKEVGSIGESVWVDRAWKELLLGMIAAERVHLAEAEHRFFEATALTQLAQFDDQHPLADIDTQRMVSLAWHHLGRVYRRQDRPDHARKTHQAAYDLRRRFGQVDEQWETAVELGMDADIASKPEEAVEWYRTAIDLAGRTGTDSLARQARANARLSASLARARRFDEAVSAAREACSLWRRHDHGGADAALANARLGAVLLEQGAALHGGADPGAGEVLRQAVADLSLASRALEAFGTAYDVNVRACEEQIDLAQRLIASHAEDATQRHLDG